MHSSNWNFTKYNGFILTAIDEVPNNADAKYRDIPWDLQKSYWVQFISECREDKEVYAQEISGLAGTHATPTWWTAGWKKVFDRYSR
jgi:hypothetical protein